MSRLPAANCACYTLSLKVLIAIFDIIMNIAYCFAVLSCMFSAINRQRGDSIFYTKLNVLQAVAIRR